MDARLTFGAAAIRAVGEAKAAPRNARPAQDRRPLLDDAKAVLPAAAIAAATGLASLYVLWLTGLSRAPVRLTYIGRAVTVIQLLIVAWAAIELWRSARLQEKHPGRAMAARLRDRMLLLALPTLVLPLFLASYTLNKTAIAFLVPFAWDGALADLDAALFGTDPWRLTHAAIGATGTRLLEFVYILGWGAVFAFTAPLIALYGSVRLVGRFYLAMMLTWGIGGNIVAYLMASAGPVLAQHSSAALGERFAPLRASLDGLLPADSLVRATQDYLNASVGQPMVVTGGGISAMPSMHVATVVIFALAARGTRWWWPALAMVALISLGSVHFGFHYSTDALLGGAIAWGAWRVAGCWFGQFRDAPGILDAKTGRSNPAIG